MKNVPPNLLKYTLTTGLVVATALSSFYIPLKANNIDVQIALGQSYEIITRSYTSAVDLAGSVASGVTKVSNTLTKSKYLNFFSIEPEALLQLTAPIFNLLPLTPTESSDQNQSTESTQNSLKEDLSSLGTPINTTPSVPDPSKALVNIFCSQKIGTLRKTITGSGVLLNKDGTVLTNAHVAEFPLLSETNMNIVCLARYGNPAEGSLSMKVAFISPLWIQTYGKYINNIEAEPQTGQSDFAILKLETTKNTSLSPLPINTEVPQIGEPITVTAYPADILGIKGVDSSLPQQKEALTIKDIYSVGTLAQDIMETSPSTIVGQRGSSGGALTDESNNLRGIIAMITSNGGSGSNGNSSIDIRALTLAHIDSELARYSSIDLSSIVQNGSDALSQDFNLRYKSYLSSLLSNYLNN